MVTVHFVCTSKTHRLNEELVSKKQGQEWVVNLVPEAPVSGGHAAYENQHGVTLRVYDELLADEFKVGSSYKAYFERV